MRGGSTRPRHSRIIQVVGLPGSGKTTGITAALDLFSDVTYLDTKDFLGVSKYDRLPDTIRNALSPVVVESACGVRGVKSTEIILVDVPFATACARCENRDGHVDRDYMSLLRTQIMAPTHITSPDLLPTLLRELLRDQHEDCRDSC